MNGTWGAQTAILMCARRSRSRAAPKSSSFSRRTFAAIVGSARLGEPLLRLVQEAHLDAREAGLAGEQLERLGHERLRVREVGEVVPQRERRERVDRLGDEQAARAQLGGGELEQPHERGRRAGARRAAPRRCRRASRPRGPRGTRPRPPARRRAPRRGRRRPCRRRASTPRASMPASRSSAEELAAAAADVEHGRRVAKVVDVGPLPLAHALGRARASGSRRRSSRGSPTGRQRRRRRSGAAGGSGRSRRSSRVSRSSSSTRRVWSGEGVDAALQLLPSRRACRAPRRAWRRRAPRARRRAAALPR